MTTNATSANRAERKGQANHKAIGSPPRAVMPTLPRSATPTATEIATATTGQPGERQYRERRKQQEDRLKPTDKRIPNENPVRRVTGAKNPTGILHPVHRRGHSRDKRGQNRTGYKTINPCMQTEYH